MSEEDDTYSTMFTALKHPIRRKILRIINQSQSTYTDILSQLSIDNGLLNYHLENMKVLLSKDEQGSARAPVSFFSLTNTKVKAIFLIMIIAIGSMGSYIIYNQLQSAEKPITTIVIRLDDAKYSGQSLLGFNGLLRVVTDSTLSGANTGSRGYGLAETAKRKVAPSSWKKTDKTTLSAIHQLFCFGEGSIGFGCPSKSFESNASVVPGFG